MKNTEGTEAAKRAAGEAAAAAVADGDVVGLGTGSTAAHAICDLGERVADGLAVEGVATSYQSRALAREAGIPLLSLSDVARVDLAIDGADQVATGANALVKGGGAAHAREKVVASAADEFLVVADGSKLADPLDHPVPVEVLPDAVARVERAVRDAGGDPALRDAERKDGPVITDNGNLVLDCDFGTIAEPASLARTLSGIAGVVEHGLFVGMADAVFVGGDDGDVTRRSP
ncbi:ribose-5-phosphate isomerase RpiA [Halobaculum gomorrense]|uniref:Ribose-5-phosphate isomerase A n=1 Tax=Halobaculum gomorrense TaxID=43928 RepID=A0A1M5QGE3_9EURY|nr:ribose-5-phosphate isomerase RpiA [Halobaculum gomorrense]SHH12910.1 ribose-5-phosphate isomerase [Halobaculum gomorrense]